jgi:hypothetical protein
MTSANEAQDATDPRRHRGFYSEYLQEQADAQDPAAFTAGPQGDQGRVSLAKTAHIGAQLEPVHDYDAYLESLNEPGPREGLVENLNTGFASNHPWVRNHDYPPGAIQPKVFISGRKGDPPRPVEIERRKREYAELSRDLSGILRDLGVDHSVPPRARTFLALEAFDDEAYEVRTTEEWLQLGVEQEEPVQEDKAVAEEGEHEGDRRESLLSCGSKALSENLGVDTTMADTKADSFSCVVPCLALSKNADQTGQWLEARMIGYDWETQLYKIRFEGGEGNVDYLTRLEVYFLAEDPTHFSHRVVAAHRMRDLAEKRLRYSLYIDCMPTDDMTPLNSEQINRMLNSALCTDKLRNSNLDTTGLIEEANIDFSRTMNKIVFDLNLKRPKQKELAETLAGVLHEDETPVPETALYETPPHNFGEQCGEFAFHSFLTNGEVILALQRVRNQCNLMMNESLFTVAITKTVRLDEFETMQGAMVSNTLQFIRDQWIPALRSDIRNSLKGVGKGSFNIFETKQQIY